MTHSAKAFQGEPEVAIAHAARATRLSPQDAQMSATQTATARGHLFLRRDDEASSWAEALRQQPDFVVATCVAAAAAALAGRVAEAAGAMTRLREIDPALWQGNLYELLPFRRPEVCPRWVEGLHLGGLPE